MGHGRDYIYPHDYPGHWVPQQYLPEGVQGLPFYEPTDEGGEARIKKRMEARTGSPEVEPEGSD